MCVFVLWLCSTFDSADGLPPSISEKEESKNHYGPTCFLNKMCPGGGGSCNSVWWGVWSQALVKVEFFKMRECRLGSAVGSTPRAVMMFDMANNYKPHLRKSRP